MVRKFANIYSIRFQVVAVHADVASAASSGKKAYLHTPPHSLCQSVSQSVDFPCYYYYHWGCMNITICSAHDIHAHPPTYPSCWPDNKFLNRLGVRSGEFEAYIIVSTHQHHQYHTSRGEWVKVGLVELSGVTEWVHVNQLICTTSDKGYTLWHGSLSS